MRSVRRSHRLFEPTTARWPQAAEQSPYWPRLASKLERQNEPVLGPSGFEIERDPSVQRATESIRMSNKAGGAFRVKPQPPPGISRRLRTSGRREA